MSITVIIADDHSIVREGLKLLLETQPDIKVAGSASNGRETVRLVERSRPDVVVMDIVMPELNGIEATRKITRTCSGTKVVILSMYSAREHVFQALHAGAHGYVLKESVVKELIDAIRAVHLGNRYLSRKISDLVVEDYLSPRKAREPKSPLSLLSQREREILQLVAEGKTSSEIGEILFISPKTAETYRSRLIHKLGIKDLPGLVKFAIQHGLISLE